MIRAAIISMLITATTCTFAQEPPASALDATFDRSTIVIDADRHRCYRFDVYLADSAAQQRRGLMHVRELPRMTGMLFSYRGPGMRSMWMKNTYIPLDMLFIRKDGTVASIVAHTEPLSLAQITSSEPVVYVLELNAGVTEQLDIGSDSRVQFFGAE